MYRSHGWWFPDQDTHFAAMLAKNIAKGGGAVYQEPVRRASIAACKNKSVALDIGANVGLWTRDLCEKFNQVIAFEPVEDFRACLKNNVTANNLFVETCAVGAQDTWIDMIITLENTGHSHVNPHSIGQGKIRMNKLDSMNLPKFDYVKIDCEGYEFNILMGGENYIKEYKPIIVVEQKFHNDTGIIDNGESIDLLKQWGARVINKIRNDIIIGWL